MGQAATYTAREAWVFYQAAQADRKMPGPVYESETVPCISRVKATPRRAILEAAEIYPGPKRQRLTTPRIGIAGEQYYDIFKIWDVRSGING